MSCLSNVQLGQGVGTRSRVSPWHTLRRQDSHMLLVPSLPHTYPLTIARLGVDPGGGRPHWLGGRLGHFMSR